MDDDMISKLPDVLIQQILSSLSMDEAVRTSTLSKRWEFLWTSFSNLVFDVRDGKCITFVDRALFLRESRIKKFSICLNHYVHCDSAAIHLKRWITDIVRLEVEELHLDFLWRRFGDSFEFPYCLFTCGSLTSFSLCSRNFRFPSSTNLSNLKNLVLEYVHFVDAESVESVFNGCPMLETASLLRCSFSCDSRISGPKLYELVIKEVKQFRDTCSGMSIKIFGPSLKSFHLRGYLSNSYCLNDQPSLDDAVIEIKYQHDSVWVWELFAWRFCELLKGLPLVKKLSLSSDALQALGYEEILPADVPIFKNLSILSFFGYCPIGLDLGDNYIGLIKILQNSPCLETLHFDTSINLSANYEEYELMLNLVPLHFLSTLKTQEIRFWNIYDYLKVFMNDAKLLLEKASVLIRKIDSTENDVLIHFQDLILV